MAAAMTAHIQNNPFGRSTDGHRDDWILIGLPQRRGRLRRRSWCEKHCGTPSRVRHGIAACGELRARGPAETPGWRGRRAVGEPAGRRLRAAAAAQADRRLPALPGVAVGRLGRPGRAGRWHRVPGGPADQPQRPAVRPVRRAGRGDRGASDRRHDDPDQGRLGRRFSTSSVPARRTCGQATAAGSPCLTATGARRSPRAARPSTGRCSSCLTAGASGSSSRPR
jgi:hypothetical protein